MGKGKKDDAAEESFSENGEVSPENLVATFQTLSAEGDLLLQKGSFHEAIDVYSKALALRPTDKHCLVCRSRCYILIGSPVKALADADASLAEDPTYFKGLFQKAEALYSKGDFEVALMYYHRGNRLRPELNEFRIGIQKAREAIDNSIGDPKAMRIKVPQKLRRNLATLAASQQPNKSDGSVNGAAGGGGGGGSGNAGAGAVSGAAGGGGSLNKAGVDGHPPYYLAGHLTDAMEGKLLGELYDDKVYLEELLTDRDFVEYPDEQVLLLVNEGLRYLNTRIEFWRQQYPLYARKPEKRIVPRMTRHGPAGMAMKPSRLPYDVVPVPSIGASAAVPAASGGVAPVSPSGANGASGAALNPMPSAAGGQRAMGSKTPAGKGAGGSLAPLPVLVRP